MGDSWRDRDGRHDGPDDGTIKDSFRKGWTVTFPLFIRLTR